MSTRTDDRVSVSVFVDPRDRERLVELALAHDRSISAEIRRAIRQHVERDDDEDESDPR